ncbi:MAG: DUF418 domain-containing protein [Aquimonas sp.]|nr:DUF418 domain-containing protein [Aquimonas sp.]
MSQPDSAFPSAERQETIDILRGLALVLILVVHCAFDFTGWGWTIPKEALPGLPLAALDGSVAWALEFFLREKSRALFALMFGVAFALQLQRSQQLGEHFERVFARRMAVLAVIGLLHGHLLYGFDVLRLYVIAGLLLLLLWRLPGRALWAMIAFATTLGPFLFFAIARMLGMDLGGGMPDIAEIHAGHTSSSPLPLIALNHQLAMGLYLPVSLFGTVLPILGCFLLGLWLARTGWLQDALSHRADLLRLTQRGLLFGLLLQGGSTLLWWLMGPQASPAHMVLAALMHFAAAPVLALGYLGAVAVLATHPFWHAGLRWLAPAGRMTLTNYLMQSVLAWLIFYGVGLGLYGRIGPAVAVPIALALALLQIGLSALWLRHHRLGPLEWLWRWAIRGVRPGWRRPVTA